MYRWELDGPALQEFADLPQAARVSLAAFMDAVVIADPAQYQRRDDERDDVLIATALTALRAVRRRSGHVPGVPA